jgi:AraC-like DNA-binding protein
MGNLVPASPALTFTTRGIPPPSRRQALHQLSEQGLLPVVPLPDAAPRVDLVKWRLPGAAVLCGTFAGVRQGSEPASGGPDEVFFGINAAGASLASQHKQDTTISAGDAVVIDPDGGAFTVLRPEPCQLIGVRIPRRAVSPGTISGPPLRLVPARTAALQLLTRYLRSVLSGPMPSSALLADALVTHLTDLIELSLLEPDGLPSRAPSVRAARLSAIKADIGQHLTNSSLSVAALAARHGISPRYLHKLFEDEAMTYSQYVLDQRLALAYRKLRHPRFSARTISSVAHDAGFGDLSYFNRTFRRRYGIAPSDARPRIDPRSSGSAGATAGLEAALIDSMTLSD